MKQDITFPPVLIDTREQKPFSFDGSVFKETEVRKLEYGDYCLAGLEHKLFIERKATVVEIASNVVEQRFKNLIEKIRDYKWKFLICEFSYDQILMFPDGAGIPEFRKKQVKVSPAFILAYLSTLMVRYGINVAMCGNKEAANAVCIDILKRVNAARIS